VLLLIIIVGLGLFSFAPKAWFDRMALIEHYEEDGSATSRLEFWRASLRIAEERPFVGGGFNVTLWPNAVNPLLLGTDIPRYTVGKATHSSHFQVLSEHGWVGYGLFFLIGAYSWFSCSWLIRRSRDRPGLVWANLLGRMGQAALLGYWVGGAFQSLAYLDEYWCLLFILDAARRIVAREFVSPAGAFVFRPRPDQHGLAIPRIATSNKQPGLVEGR
jgi:putative inorganic carbon (hco3(-)) transporter